MNWSSRVAKSFPTSHLELIPHYPGKTAAFWPDEEGVFVFPDPKTEEKGQQIAVFKAERKEMRGYYDSLITTLDNLSALYMSGFLINAIDLDKFGSDMLQSHKTSPTMTKVERKKRREPMYERARREAKILGYEKASKGKLRKIAHEVYLKIRDEYPLTTHESVRVALQRHLSHQ